MHRIALLLFAVFAALGHAAAPPADPAPGSLAARVWPILQAKCSACHGDDAKKLRGGLDLRSRDTALRGGDSGKPAFVPGKPDGSPLYVAVTRRDTNLVMPPKENDRLSAAEVELVRRWVAAGAPWPGGDP